MLNWLKKWHVWVAIIFAVYFSIPKPSDPIYAPTADYLPKSTSLKTTDGYEITLKDEREFDKEDDEELVFDRASVSIDTRPDGKTEKEDPKTFTVALTDEIRKQSQEKVSGRFSFYYPWHRFKVNLGQDLAGGTSLRFLIRSKDVVDAETRLSNLYNAWINRIKSGSNNFPDDIALALNKFRDNPDRVPVFTDAERALLRNSGAVPVSELDALDADTAKRAAAEREAGAKDMVGQTIETLNRRLNASGMTELNIRGVGTNEIEVKIPALAAAHTERIKETLRSTGALEFMLLPNVKDVLGDKTAKDIYPNPPDKNPTWYEWYEIQPNQTAADLFAKDGGLKYSPEEGIEVEADADRKEPVFGGDTDANKLAVVLDRTVITKFTDKKGQERTARIRLEAVLVQKHFPDPSVSENYPISGKFLADATPSADKFGAPAVSFKLKNQGIVVMQAITGKHHQHSDDPRHLAVAIDNRVYSAPGINEKLGEDVQVHGSFTRAEVKQFIDTLKSGQLPVSLKLTSEETVGPSEGADNIHRGMMSLLIGAVAVFVFALIFYRRTGLLTMLNLVLIVLLILAIMSLFLSTLTLPGIAGLVLTLGMAIDANVLINERIKEERRLGAGPRAALHAGFNKAFTAIVDGNLTTLLTGIILTKVGSGAVAGFALSLCIGILATLYVALLVYKTSMYWCFEKGVITEVKGLELFKQTNWNIVGFGRKIALINLIVMLGTFSFFLYRWDKNLGLDFLGGNQIVVQFTEPTSRESVLKAVESIKNADGLPKYSAVEAQARFALKDADEKDADENERTSSGGKSFEIRFPSKTGADVTDARSEEIKSDLRQAFNGLDGKPKLVQDGFSTSFSTVEEAELRATVSVSRPEGIEPSMLDTDNWLNYLPGFDAGDTDKLKNDWFKDIDGTVQTPSFKTATDKQTQAITFVIADVKIKGNKLDDAAQKFHGALKDKLTAIGAGVMSKDDAFPAKDDIVQARASKGQITALVRLDKPEDTAVFSAKLRELSGKLEDSLIQSGIVIVNATGAIENNAGREFEIKTPSGKITWDDNGRAQTVAALERLQPQIEDWFNEDGSGNHVSNPFPRASAIGSRVAGETQARAVIALILSLIGIIIYMGVRFKGAAWGYAGVSALIQDVLITLGALAVADEIFGDIKLDLNAVAALLTVIGYSINDTIVIFDRIREELKIDFDTGRKRPFPEVINVAVNRTFSRTVLTGASVFAVVLAMLVLGGPAIRSFSLTLFFGLLFGTYFSIVRAGPFLLFFTGKSKDVLAEFERELAAKKEAERAEAEAMAAISLEREAAENSGDEPQPQGSK